MRIQRTPYSHQAYPTSYSSLAAPTLNPVEEALPSLLSLADSDRREAYQIHRNEPDDKYPGNSFLQEKISGRFQALAVQEQSEICC